MQNNFKYLNDLIHSGKNEIILDTDIELDVEEISEYEDGINLDFDNLVIDGNGHFIDAKGKARIFTNKSKNVIIKNITLKNGFHEGYCEFEHNYHGGGAIYNMGNLKVMDSILFNNKSENGGAIYNYHGKLSIVNSKLYENLSKSEYSGGGGAICNNNGSLNIVDCELYENFSRNRNYEGGGALYNYKDGELKITNSILKKNSAPSGYGGAIYNDGNIIIKKIFSYHNIADWGGFIFNKGNLIIGNSRLLNNMSESSGGAIENYYEGKIKISNSSFEENISYGKVDGGGTISNRIGSISIESSFFSKNSIKNGKGSVMFNVAGNINISQSTFSDNITQEDNLGLIVNEDAFLTISDSKFLNNKSDDSGILIYNDYGPVKIFKCEFIENMANNLIVNEDYLEIEDTAFNKNHSEYLILNKHDRSRISIYTSEFIGNIVEKYAIYHSGNNCTIYKTSFENNITTTKNCQDIYNCSKLNLINPKIKSQGKTILNEGKIFIKEYLMDLNQKICGSGIIETNVYSSDNEIKNDFSHLDKLIHESNAKEIILEDDISLKDYEQDFYEGGIELDVDDLLIDGNGKTINGADKSRIFIITGKNITLKNITFSKGHSYKHYNNYLNSPGGAIRINAHSNVNIINCNFIENHSELNAGALYNKGDLTIDNSKICRNKITGKQDGGGAIFNSGHLLIINSEILENNTSDGSGGAIYNTGILSIEKSSFINNDSKDYPLAIVNDSYVENIEPHALKFPKNTYKIHGIKEDKGGKLYISESILINSNLNSFDYIINMGDLVVSDTITELGKIDEKAQGIFNYDYGKLTIQNSNNSNENLENLLLKYISQLRSS